MAPKHKNPTSKERTAVAPYNFIPAADPVITFPDDERNPLGVDQGQYQPGRWTGWMDVNLSTYSPLYVRGPLTPEEHNTKERQDRLEDKSKNAMPHLDKLRNKPDFFHVGDPTSPTIPGSSLRGMIRSIVEILGHGKLKPVMNTPLVYRAVGDTSSHGEAYRKLLMEEVQGEKHHYRPLFKGGYIREDKRNGRWYIQPATEVTCANGTGPTTYARINKKRIPRGHLERWHGCRNASQIYVSVSEFKPQEVRGGFLHIQYAKVNEATEQERDDLIPCVLARSGDMFSKRTEAVIFPPDPNKNNPEQWIPIPDGSDENDPRDLVTAYRDQITPKQEELLGRDGVLRDYHPIFYRMEGEKLLFFFGHTQMYRMPYPRSPQEMLPPPHYDENRMDFAEAMFGKVRGQSGGIAGRIFISDAYLHPEQDRDQLWLEEGDPVVIPKVLAAPNPTTFQHYLTQSKPDVPQGKGLYTYNDSPSQTTLRGHKLYWHKGDDLKRSHFAEEPKNIDRQKDKIHTQIKPVRKDVRFTFRIHFENLLPAELGLLWWSVALPVKDNQLYCHKLGMGKPLGLGAVKLEPSLHLISPEMRYSSLFTGDTSWSEGETLDLVNDVLAEAVDNFEKFVLRTVRASESSLANTERVQMLLKMLIWPGPSPTAEKSRYMEIEYPDPRAKRGKRNEYKDRPVLPDPLNI